MKFLFGKRLAFAIFILVTIGILYSAFLYSAFGYNYSIEYLSAFSGDQHTSQARSTPVIHNFSERELPDHPQMPLYSTETFHPSTSSSMNITVDLQNLINSLDIRLLKLLENADVIIFLIEPRILLGFLNAEDLQLLSKREVDIKSFSGSTNLTTYGIFEKESNNINDHLVSRLKQEGYSYYKMENMDARQFHWDKPKDQSATINTHHFFVRNHKVIQLVVFYIRNQFWWFPELTNLPPEVEEIVPFEDLSFGRYASAFDVFSLIPMQFAAIYTIFVPSDPKAFLLEVSSSKFLECNLEVARKFYSENSKDNRPSEKFNKRVSEAIKSVKLITKPFFVPFWICSGTLLGWYRQCDVIPYTSDVDFAAWVSDFDENFHQNAQKPHGNLRLKIVYGVPEESLQYAFYSYSLRVDFFFTYRGKDKFWYGGHRPERHLYFHYIFPTFTLCSGELLGHKVLVPCTPEEVVAAEYGKEWKKPVKRWTYDSSAYNIGPKEHWPDSLKNKVYKKF